MNSQIEMKKYSIHVKKKREEKRLITFQVSHLTSTKLVKNDTFYSHHVSIESPRVIYSSRRNRVN